MSKCLIVQLPGQVSPGRLDVWAREAGVEPVVVCADSADDLAEHRGFDGLVMVGGPIDPYDSRTVSLESLGHYVALMVGRQRPTLGIGGGAHLVSVALGGRVGLPPDTPLPVGVRTTRRTAQGSLDPLLSRGRPSQRWLVWSRIALTELPESSQILSVDDAGLPQAVRFGPSVWGFPGHPELNESAIQDWARRNADELPPDRDTEAVARELADIDDVCDTWAPVLRRFFGLVADGR